MGLFKKKIEDDFLDQDVGKSKGSIVKKLLLPILIILIIIIVVALKVLLGGSGSKMNYYDTMTNIFANELGTFKYVFDVRTGERGSLIKDTTPITVTVDDLNDAEADLNEEVKSDTAPIVGTGIATQSEGESTQKHEFADWNKYSTVKSGAWDYPKYTITVEGVTTSVDPVKTDFTVKIATPNYNGLFTRIVCDGTNYYFDSESMYSWLSNSGDDYLIEVGSKLPNGSKWIVVPVSSFKYPSSYAESGEMELSNATSLSQLYNRFTTGVVAVNNVVKGAMGKDGMQINKDTVALSLSGDSATKLANVIKGIISGSGSLYSNIVNSGREKGLYNDDQYKQALREKDNFMTAMFDFVKYVETNDMAAANLQVGGFARSYVNNLGNNTLEGTMKMQFVSPTNDHVIEIRGFRSGNGAEITAPEGSTTSDNYDLLVKAVKSMTGYFNTTLISSSVQLENNPTTMSKAIIDKFIALVNETGTAGYRVTEFNVMGFIEKYANYEVTDASSDNDMINARLVMDLAETLNNIVGGIIIEKVVEEEVVVEQYPKVEYTDGNTYVTVQYNTNESDAHMMIADVEIINRSDVNSYIINLDEFSARTLLNSMYPANNEVMIRGADSSFDIERLVHEIEVEPNSAKSYKLYFALADDQGHFDLYLGGQNLGSLVQY